MSTLTRPTLSHSLIPESSDRPGDDPIFALNGEAQRRAQAGEDILNATLGALMADDGSLASMPSVYEAYRRIDPARAAVYAPISGPPAYLEAVRRDLFENTHLFDQSVAVATPGGTGAVHHGIQNFLEPGQRLLTTSYHWSPYGILADHARRGVATFEMFDAKGALNLEALEQAIDELLATQDRLLIVMNTPCHNPTGYSLDGAEWRRLAELTEKAAKRVPVTFLLDFAYARFAPGLHWRAALENIVSHATVLIAWTASKAFAQYGARIGALVALSTDASSRQAIQNALGYSCRGTWSNCNHLGMLAITELLTDPDLKAKCDAERAGCVRLLDERVAIFNERAGTAGLAYPRYEGGFFVSVFTPDPVAVSEKMKEDGVFVVPLQGAVRVALCATPAQSIPRVVDSLARAIACVA